MKEISNDETCQLYGIIVHTGPSADIGHYFCYVRSPQNSQWYKMDDTSVQKVNEKEVLAAKAYLLFYNKQLRPVSNQQVVPEPYAQLSSFSTFEHSKQLIPGLTPIFSNQPPQHNPLAHSGCT